MKSLGRNAGRRRHGASGFSLSELMIVLTIIIIMVSFAAMSLGPLMAQQRVTNAYNIAMSAMRLAHDQAVAQQSSYSVTFANNGSAPSTATVAPSLQTGSAAYQGEQAAVVYKLPTDIQFLAIAGIPTTAAKVPDGYGAGAVAIDFGYTASGTGTGGATTVYFCPDGSSQAFDTGKCSTNWSGGVVYLARSGDLMSSRAITLWGGTGRIRGWRLITTGGVNKWIRQ
jgi:Tfp pilus assembly protein FimT